MITFIFYYISFFFICFLFVPRLTNNQVINNKLDLTILVILFYFSLLFFGFGLFGYDTELYYDFYINTNKLSSLNLSDYKKEWGFYFLISLCKSLNISYVEFRFINMVLDLLLMFYVFRYFLEKKLWSFAFVIYLLFGGLYYNIEAIRNGKSILFFLIALKYLNLKKYCKFVLYCFFSLCFHVSAVFLIFSCFFYKLFLKKKLVFFVFCLGLILSISGKGFGSILLSLQDKLPGQIGYLILIYATHPTYNVGHGLSIGLLERIVSFFIVYKYQDEVLKDYSFSKYFIAFMYIYIFLCFYFLDFTIVYERLASLFKIGYWVLFPIIFNYQNGKQKNRIYFILFFYGLLKVYQNYNNVVYLPNQFILDNGF